MRFLNRKKWQVMPIDQDAIIRTAQELNIDAHAVLLAYTRGIEDTYSAAEFFGMEPAEDCDPFDFPDMEAAAKRIQKAVDDSESIAVYGDYDVDGVTATAILYTYLESLGANVTYYIPNRHTEGYGLNKSAVDTLHDKGVHLIVTVDNGISSVDEAEYIKSLGMELVVTDHHLPGEKLPDAVAVVDPHRQDCFLEFRDFVGAGVAYKLVCAMEGGINEVTENFIDLAALGTVADVMPLIGENRSIVRRGLYFISQNLRLGLYALRCAAGTAEKEATSSELAFALSPRINAAGRMGSAVRGLELLISRNRSQALQLADEISEENSHRQQTEQEILALAVEKIENDPAMKYSSVIVVDGEEWNDGVIGIVASRLVERYGKPSIVISKSGETATGSGRSLEGFSLYDALEASKETLTHFGGHKLAAGLGVESRRIDEFRMAINAYADNFEMPFAVQRIDYRLKLHSINEDLLEIVETMEPCGAGNPQPVFGLFNMKIESVSPIGSGKHIKLELSKQGAKIYAVKFSCTAADFPFGAGDVVDLAVQIKRNEYMNRVSVNIIIKNIRVHGLDEDKLLHEIRLFEKLMRGGRLSKEETALMTPDRELNAAVYRLVRSHSGWKSGVEMLCKVIDTDRFGAVMASVEAMKQLGLLFEKDEKLFLPESTGKVNFDDAPVIKRLKNMTEVI